MGDKSPDAPRPVFALNMRSHILSLIRRAGVSVYSPQYDCLCFGDKGDFALLFMASSYSSTITLFREVKGTLVFIVPCKHTMKGKRAARKIYT